MSDETALVPLPANQQELKIAIGKQILIHSLRVVLGEVPEYVVKSAPKQHHIDAANLWLKDQSKGVGELALAAKRALEYSDPEDGMMSFMSDSMKGDALPELLSSIGGYFSCLCMTGGSKERFTQTMRLFAEMQV